MTADIRQLLQAEPFVPFAIHVADGREYRVPTPDHAHDDRTFILPALLLSGVALDTPERFGDDSSG